MRVLERKCECTVRSIDIDNDFIRRVSKIEALLTILRPDIHVRDISIVEQTLMEVDAFISTLNAIIDGKTPEHDPVEFTIKHL